MPAGYEYRIDGVTIVDVGNVLTYDVTGLTPATEYDFEIRAYDGQGNRSAWSPVVSATTTTTPDNALALLGDEWVLFGEYIVFNP